MFIAVLKQGDAIFEIIPRLPRQSFLGNAPEGDYERGQPHLEVL